MFVVVISEKGGGERREEFDVDAVTVGRVQGNSLMLPKGNVSKRHCTLELSGGRFVLTDHNSTNGTYVNRRRITQPTLVRPGDRIYVGDFILRLEPEAEPAALGDSADVEGGVGLASSPEEPIPSAPSVELDGFAGNLVSSAPRDRGGVLPPKPELAGDAPGSDGALSREFVELAEQLIARAQAKLEPRLLERTLDEAAEKRVQRALNDALGRLQAEGLPEQDSDLERLRSVAWSELVGTGPIPELLADSETSEVALTGPGRGTVVRAGKMSEVATPLCSAESAERIARRLCRADGQDLPPSAGVSRVWLASLRVELEVLRSAGPRPHVVLVLRRGAEPLKPGALVDSGVVSPEMLELLGRAMLARQRVLVIGTDRAAAASVALALADLVPDPRVLFAAESLVVEDEEHLRLSRGRLASDALAPALRAALQLPGHRLVVGDLGEALGETLDALLACPFAGAVCGYGGAELEASLEQLAARLALERGVPWDVARRAVWGSFDLVVLVARQPSGALRMAHAAEIDRSQASGIRTLFRWSLENGHGGHHSVHPATNLPQRLSALGL